jgi:hypothetical protein
MAFKPFYRRRFLNRRGHHAGAYLIAECQIETYRDGAAHVEASFTLADCSRVAVIDLCGARPAEIANSLRKAQLVRDAMTDLCEALEEAAAEVAERRAR